MNVIIEKKVNFLCGVRICEQSISDARVLYLPFPELQKRTRHSTSRVSKIGLPGAAS